MTNINLKKAILNCGKTQKQIAAEAGIPVNTMFAYVGGWRRPRPRRQKKLAELLGKPREELFIEED